MNRRQLLKTLLALPAVSILPGVAFAAAPATLPALPEDNPVAKSLGYHTSATKVDVKKYPKKATAAKDGKPQTCVNCMFYTKIDDKKGKCQMFPANTVASAGWCNSWTQKA